MLSLFFLIFSSLLPIVRGSGVCGSTKVPTGSDVLQSASVFQKDGIFRMSIDDITDEGYSILESSGEALFATKDNAQCRNIQCMYRLYTNEKNTDKNILQQDNWLGGLAPSGYTKIDSNATKMFCVRWLGDCGATVPIYRYFIYVGANGWSHAYSMDTEVDYAGYTRELFPICYGWPSLTSAPSTDASNGGIAADKLVTLSTYVNDFTGADRDHWTTTWTPAMNSTAFNGYTWIKDVTRVARAMSSSTDALQCTNLVKVIQMFDNQVGIGGTEDSPGIFSRFDHKIILESQKKGKEANLPYEDYAPTGEYFYCVLGKGNCGATVALKKWFNGFEIDTIYTVTGDDDPLAVRNDGILCYTWPLDSSSSNSCVAAPSVANGEISYSQNSATNSYPQGTLALITCSSGYTLSGTASLTCVKSSWSPSTFGSCIVQAQDGISGGPSESVCPALTTNSLGTIVYSQATNTVGTTAILKCTDSTNYQVLGTSGAICTGSAWSPTALGVCTRICPAVSITNAAVIYRQSNGVTLATAAPYFEGYFLSFACSTGTLTGNAAATCSGGSWTPTLGSCTSTTANTCTAAPTVANGQIVYSPTSTSNTYFIGTTAKLTCSTGFSLSGTATLVCTGTTWSPTAFGTCSQTATTTSCPALTIANTVVSYRLADSVTPTLAPYLEGYRVVFMCTTGSTLVGVQTATCTKGAWTPSLGSCVTRTQNDFIKTMVS